MKNSTFIIFAFITLFSCRTIKQKSEQVAYRKEQTLSNWRMQQEERFHYIDSSGHYWYFRTDTTFYYHPDSGLQARRGTLSFWKQQWNTEYRSSSKDSSHSERSINETYSIWKKYVNKSNAYIIVFIVLLAATIFLLFLIRRRGFFV